MNIIFIILGLFILIVAYNVYGVFYKRIDCCEPKFMIKGR